jgi:hypothetical protein
MRILSDSVVNAYNWDGRKNARSLRQTFLFGQILCPTICSGWYSNADFEKDIKVQVDNDIF